VTAPELIAPDVYSYTELMVGKECRKDIKKPPNFCD